MTAACPADSLPLSGATLARGRRQDDCSGASFQLSTLTSTTSIVAPRGRVALLFTRLVPFANPPFLNRG